MAALSYGGHFFCHTGTPFLGQRRWIETGQ